MDGLNIGEIARQAGIQPSAIRYYESVGLLDPSQRVGGWRTYPPDVLERIRVIRLARDMGFAVEEVRTLLEGFSPTTPPSTRWQALAAKKLPEVEDLIARAEAMKRLLEAGLRCECLRIEDCFTDGCEPREVESTELSVSESLCASTSESCSG